MPVVKQIPIRLALDIQTRATESAFEQGDRIGLYVVNYTNHNHTAGTLENAGNHADNIKFSYDGQWKPEKEIYWKDDSTMADFYCYYPYAVSPSVSACSFEVKADQSQLTDYKASDFLWGKTMKVSPTDKAVQITTRHVFSCAQIEIEAGDGFTAESLKKAEIALKLNHLRTKATIDLSTGEATAGGEEQTIIPYWEGEVYKALVVPQTIDETDLIVVTIDGKDYKLTKGFTFVANKRHHFTIKANKTSNGINVGIGAWEEDGTDNGGVAE